MNLEEIEADLKNLTDAVSRLEKRVTPLVASQHDKRPHSYGWVIALTAAGISATAAWVSLQSFHVSRESLTWLRETRTRDEQVKSLEIADHFIDRFYQIENENDSNHPDFYYDRLYGLHLEEFTYYGKGLLDKDLYLTWLRFRYRHFHKDASAEEDQWRRVKKVHIVDEEFTRFMENVLHAAAENDIEGILDGTVASARQHG